MAFIKTEEEIQSMREGGALLSSALKAVVDAVRPGVKINELDKIGEEVILSGGGKPSFKGYKTRPTDTPFPSTVCISINDEVVHGCGDRDIVLQEGDIVGLDIGCWYKGLCTDMAVTVPVGEISDDVKKLLQITKEAMYKGVDNARVGNNVKDISQAIEDHITPHKYGIVRALVGHGVGHAVHEAPHVPNFVSKLYKKVQLVDGMCIAIEPMVGLGGSYEIETADDGWAIKMKDGSMSGHFEVTIAITNNGTEILTPLPV